MQAASKAYKAEMKECYRKQSYMRVSIGVINQEAQANAAVVNSENYTYYSSFKMPLQNYQVEELYAACCQDYTVVDGSMYFLPRKREDVVLNQGIVTEKLLGSVEIRFPIPYEIKGVTIEFGKSYPVDFSIISDENTVEITGNHSGHFVTDEIFRSTTFLRIVPKKMINGQSRLRIHQVTMGIGIYFDNRKILSATKREYVNPVTEELPSIDFDLTVENKDRVFDVENEESTVHFLEVGQEISAVYGQELEDGTVEWMPGATVRLREWSADDEQMSFSATDRFEDLDGMYYKGKYRPEGISLYDLALDVLKDAEVDSRTYWIDPYLKKVIVFNPLPVVSHKEALQLIANAGRCVLYQDRAGNILMKSNFMPDMVVSSKNETYFSHAEAVLDGKDKDIYAMAIRNHTNVQPTQYFLPRQTEKATYLNTGYISEAVAMENGKFAVNPTIEIKAEAAFKCFGITLQFGGIPPAELIIHTYLDEILQESFQVVEIEEITIIHHEFPEWNRMILEFTKHQYEASEERMIYLTDSQGYYLTDEDGKFLVSSEEFVKDRKIGKFGYRIILDNIVFGDSTDYKLSYGQELIKTPKGTQIAKVKALQVIRTLYSLGTEYKSLARESVSVTAADNRYTFYFSSPAHDYAASIVNMVAGQTVVIVDSSAYYVTVEVFGVSGGVEIEISGYEYIVTQAFVSRQLNPTGSVENWENPLVSDTIHAVDLANWIGDYMRADKEYNLKYRGEPRIDANDLMFLENKYVPNLLLRTFEHVLEFNGALSGTIKARHDMSNTAAKRR
ncbi:MAG: hypothetical protein Q4E24_14055 [bacterium]|nr:hypothetical protein [bacterium]